MNSLIKYDKENIKPEIIRKLNKILAKPEFDIPSIEAKVSYAGDLASFCKSMKIYADVNEKVKPKKQ